VKRWKVAERISVYRGYYHVTVPRGKKLVVMSDAFLRELIADRDRHDVEQITVDGFPHNPSARCRVRRDEEGKLYAMNHMGERVRVPNHGTRWAYLPVHPCQVNYVTEKGMVK
jgi:molybdopterin-guanine dinucleotide biosynthesis protein